MTMPEVVDFIDGYAQGDRGAGARPTRRSRRSAATDDGYRVDDRPRASGAAAPSCWRRGACNIADVPGVRRRPCPPAVTTLTPIDVPQPRPARRGRRARRRRIGDRRADRRRDPALGPPGHAGRRRARAGAARLPGPGHPVVDGRRRRARRALRRGRRHRAGPQRAVDAARRHRPSGPRSTSTRSPASASSWSAASPASATARAQFSGSLRNKCALADLKLGRLLDTIDEWATANGLDGEVDAAAPLRADASSTEPPPLGLDLAGGEIKTIIWATGFRPDYSWLDVPVLDRKGRSATTAASSTSPGHVPDGHAVPPPPQVEPHRRRRRRRPRPDRPPRRPPRPRRRLRHPVTMPGSYVVRHEEEPVRFDRLFVEFDAIAPTCPWRAVDTACPGCLSSHTPPNSCAVTPSRCSPRRRRGPPRARRPGSRLGPGCRTPSLVRGC